MVDLNLFVIYLFADIFLFSFQLQPSFLSYMHLSSCGLVYVLDKDHNHILRAYSKDTLHYISFLVSDD